MEGICLVYRGGSHKGTRKQTVTQLLSSFQTQLQCPVMLEEFISGGLRMEMINSVAPSFMWHIPHCKPGTVVAWRHEPIFDPKQTNQPSCREILETQNVDGQSLQATLAVKSVDGQKIVWLMSVSPFEVGTQAQDLGLSSPYWFTVRTQ